MKITVITDSNGKIAGTIKGQIKDFYAGDMLAGPMVSEGMKLHEIEVPDEFEKYYRHSASEQAGMVNAEEDTKKSQPAQDHSKNNLDELHKKAAEYIKSK